MSAKGIESQLQDSKEIQDAASSNWTDSLFAKVRSANDRLDKNTSVRLGFAYSVLGLVATDHEPGESGGVAGDFDLFGRWKFGESSTFYDGILGFSMRHRHRITGTDLSQMGALVGSLWEVTAGFTDTGFDLTQLYLDLDYLDKRLKFRIGQIYQDHHFDLATYKSQKLFFVNAAFSDNPVVPFPDASVGVAAHYWVIKDGYVTLGAGDSQGRKLDGGFDPLLQDKLFSGVELGWAPTTGAFEDHFLSWLAWYAPAKEDSAQEDGYGWSVIWEWLPEIPFGIFARAGRSFHEATETDRMVTAGMVWREPFGREQDRFGVAVGWGQPNIFLVEESVAKGAQTVIEVFHRFQVTPWLQITPDLQLILNPSRNFEEESVWVAGLRGRIAL